ncbi:MAG: type I methionyl aminopeptidase [Phycisphaerae bacterium]|jgi:methionyl aminopeptidase|nr:type I methionyl aminopeptidase [Phycisphaerae bacterium]MBT5409210.1 type I methionyl aminopeptidase [Phycisphaerae bacterium]MBT7658302.1 type I methionyl aminopeptidase [Phycisphaerae bacterium]
MMKTIPLLRGKEVEAAKKSASHVVEVHKRLTEFLSAGVTLPEIDTFVASVLGELKSKSAFLKYKIPGQPPFPSHSCLSVNDCVVHGTHTMSLAPLQPGDLISIDIGVTHQGWIGDAAWTWAIEHAEDEHLRLMQAGKDSLAAGVNAMQPGRPLIDFAKACQNVAEDTFGFHLIRGLGGHGYGKTLHAPPFISNVVPSHPAEWPDAWRLFEPGMLIAVEPMLAIGTNQIENTRGTWPIYSADHSMSVHYEADILISEDGPIDLTEGLQDLPNIVG